MENNMGEKNAKQWQTLSNGNVLVVFDHLLASQQVLLECQ